MTTIEVSYSAIAKELGIDPKSWNSKVKKSLMKLAQARYTFTQCFLLAKDGELERKDTYFSLFETAELYSYKKGTSASTRRGKSRLYFPEPIKQNLEEKYYQFLEMEWYKALPTSVSKRLYEYLEKKRYKSDLSEFKISLEYICNWIPIADSNITKRKQIIQKYVTPLIEKGYLSNYIFDEKKRICIFEYAKTNGNKLILPPSYSEPEIITLGSENTTKSADSKILLNEIATVMEWFDSIPYFHKSKRRKIGELPIQHIVSKYPAIKKEYEYLSSQGKKPKSVWIYEQFMQDSSALSIDEKTKKLPSNEQFDFIQNEHKNELEKLFELLDKPTEAKKKVVENFYNTKGYDYVYWSILYANKHSKNKHHSYLTKTLDKGWAEGWAEEEKLKLHEKQKEKELDAIKQASEKQKMEEENQILETKNMFNEEVKKLSLETKLELLEKSKVMVPSDEIGRIMKIKIEYVKHVLNYININGARNYPSYVIQNIGDINQITSDIDFS